MKSTINRTSPNSRNLASSASLLAMFGVLCGLPAAAAVDPSALPTGGSPSSGNVTFDYSNPSRLNVQQTSNRAVVDWNTFNVGSNATTEFFQPGRNSVIVNRVSDVNPSQINGSLKANGHVIILNPNGIAFGGGSKVDVGGLVASTGTINETEFMNSGAVQLNNLNTGGKIVNDGTITIADSGIAAFVAPDVTNNGVINARLGKVELAAGGDRATVDLYGDNLVELALDTSTSKAIATNKGQINANGGIVSMTAVAAAGVVDSVINTGGKIEANTVDLVDGRIILRGQNAKINVQGTVEGSTITADTDRTITVADNTGVITPITPKTAVTGTSANGSVSLNSGEQVIINHAPVSGAGEVTINAKQGVSIAQKGSVAAAGDVAIDGDSDNNGAGNVTIASISRVTGDNITIKGQDVTSADYNGTSAISSVGGNILIDNDGVYGVQTVRTGGTGTITINQHPTGTLQSALNSMINSGNGMNTINLSAGSWTEQVTIARNNVTINGSGQNQSRIYAPIAMVQNFSLGGVGVEAVIYVRGDNVNIQNLNVEGMNHSSANRVAGIAYLNSSGTVQNVFVKDFNPVTAIRHEGTGIYVANTDGVDRTVTLADNLITRFEMNGIWATGAGLNLVADGNNVQGIGTRTGQTGIRVDNAASTSVTANSVTGVEKGVQVNGVTQSIVANNNVTARGNGIILQNSGSGSVTDNTIQAGGTGVFFVNSANGIIANNDINGQNQMVSGIYVNTASAGTVITDNVIDDVIGTGIIAYGVNQITDNAIDGAGTGIDVFDNIGGTVRGNAVDNTTDHGIRARNSNGIVIADNIVGATATLSGIAVINSDGASVDGNDVGNARYRSIYMLNSDGASATGNTVHNGFIGIAAEGLNTTIAGNAITGMSGDAISVANAVSSTINGNVVTTAGRGVQINNVGNAVIADNIMTDLGTGIFTTGTSNGAIVLRNNTLTSNGDGAVFASGAISFEGVNSFTSAKDGLVFDPAQGGAVGNLSVAGNTFGSTVLSGQNGYYIRLANGALFQPDAPAIYDARSVSFDGFTPGSFTLTLAQLNSLESKLYDFDDDVTLGQIFFTTIAFDGADVTDILPDQPLGRIALNRAGAVTIVGLPYAPGAVPASVLANLDSAAGGDVEGAAAGLSPEQLNDLDSAAGGAEAGCWGDVYSRLGTSTSGNPVSFTLDGDPQSLIAAQAGCRTASGT